MYTEVFYNSLANVIVLKMNPQDLYEHAWVESYGLTPREVDVLACLLENQASKKIALILGINQKTVDTHVLNIMNKTDKHVRVSLIEFVKKSFCVQDLRMYYSELIAASEFQKTLKKIKQQMKIQNVVCKIACKDEELKEHIESDLKSLDIICFERKKEATIILIEPQDSYYQTFFDVLYQLLPYSFVLEAINQFKENVFESPNNGKTSKTNNQEELSVKSRSFLAMTFLGFISVGIVGSGLFVWYQQVQYIPIRSDFAIPTAAYYLNRPKLISQISEKLKKPHGIQTVVLLGMGGMGKTTLAREYASTQDLPVVWEINAENSKKILISFEQLASVLARTPADQRAIEFIKKIEKEQEYRTQLVQFVRQRLCQQKKWLMVFDNVDDFLGINPFFPIDPKGWGNGQILITTRNSHFKNNTYIHPDNVILVTGLDLCEQTQLFTKIMYGSKKLTDDQLKKTEEFLKQLPPFPLDISIAAHYIKNTGLSFTSYLRNLNILNNDFDKSQESFGQQINDYGKTRYGIISSALQHIVQRNQNFAPLLLLISTIGSQDIPKNLLCCLTKEQDVERFIFQMSISGLLTYAPKNHSLSLHRSTQKNITAYLQNMLTFEQKKGAYEKVVMALERYSLPIINKIDCPDMRAVTDHLDKFLHQTTQLEVVHQGIIQSLLGIINALSGNPVVALQFLNASFSNLLSDFGNKPDARLMRVMLYIGFSEKEEGNFERSQKFLERCCSAGYVPGFSDTLDLASAYNYLADVYIYVSKLELAEKAIEKSLQICQKQNKPSIPLALGFAALASLYHEGYDNYQKAEYYGAKSIEILKKVCGGKNIQTLLATSYWAVTLVKVGKYQEAIQAFRSSYDDFKNDYPNGLDDFSFTAIRLGDAYRIIGDYKKAEIFLNEGFQVREKYFGTHNTQVDWGRVFLGQLYVATGNYPKAVACLEKSLAGHIKHYGKTHQKIGWISHPLAVAYMHLGAYKKAQKYFDCALSYYIQRQAETHLDYAFVLKEYGHFHTLKKDYLKAESILKQALTILEHEKHPDRYKCYEYLGDLYAAQGLQKQSITNYSTALKIAKISFPKYSAHIVRLKSKTPLIKRLFL